MRSVFANRLKRRILITMLLTVHALLLAWAASRDSFVWTEVGLLPSGIYHWQHGRFDTFRVNPPLQRMLATLPLLLTDFQWPPVDIPSDHRQRAEWNLGNEFVALNGLTAFRMLTIARYTCIPICLLGGLLVYHWSQLIYGRAAGLLSLTLWCLSPNILAHGHLLTGDLAAATAGLATMYCFGRWVEEADWRNTFRLGLLIGIAILTKLTWLALALLLPVLLFVLCLSFARWRSTSTILSKSGKLAAAFLIGLLVVNVSYGFQGSFKPLGDYQFASQILSGHDIASDQQLTESSEQTTHKPSPLGNRFDDSIMQHVRVPLPEDFVLGIDLQKWDVSRPRWSYLRGQWRERGWWYYYLYGLGVKIPLGTWAILFVAACVTLQKIRSGHWLDHNEVIIFATGVFILVLVSLQLGLNKHVRYVLPVFPFLFIVAGQAATLWSSVLGWRKFLVPLFLALTVASCLSIAPHWLAFFNQASGGARNGHYHLLSSNIDWGQDLLRLKYWLDQHPEIDEIDIRYHLRLINPSSVGIENSKPTSSPTSSTPTKTASSDSDGTTWPPGWYAISVNHLHHRSGNYQRFLLEEPVDRVGFTLYIFHLDPKQ